MSISGVSRLDTSSIGRILALLRSIPERMRHSDGGIARSTYVIGTVVVVFGVAGLVAIWMWGYGLSDPTVKGQNAWTIVAADLLVAGAAAAVGGLLGFLFGIPRTLDPASRVAVAAAAGQQGQMASSQAALAANTNLERISDWFTTLLIGATLVQIKDVTGWVGGIGSNLASGTMANQNIVPVIVIYFSALSFTGVYLITRLYLTFALQQTLVLLTGSSSQAPIQNLKADIADALATGNTTDLAQASGAFDAWAFQGDDRNDPGLNYGLARMFARLLASGTVDDRRDEVAAKLGDAVRRASASADVKKQLADDVSSGRLTSGVPDVDSRVKAMVAP